MSLIISGIGVCRGIAIGKARILSAVQHTVVKQILTEEEIEPQVLRYRAAVAIAKQQLFTIRKEIPQDAPEEIRAFIDSHILMLEDNAFVEAPIEIIYEQHCNAEWALQCQRDRLVAIFKQMDDAYLRAREDDINHLVHRIQAVLLNSMEDLSADNKFIESEPHIVITEDLSPADIVLLKVHGGISLVTEQGGPTSHAAILARSLNIPTIVGAKNICQYLKENETIIVDGSQGLIIADPEQLYHKHYEKKQVETNSQLKILEKNKKTPTTTADGVAISLKANIELPSDIGAAQNAEALGIGLFRTEYLFLNRQNFPDESEQLHAYLDVITGMSPNAVTIRTMDLGNDKSPLQYDEHFSSDPNPALGLRGLRFCLQEPQLFRTQLRAILRSSALGPVNILLPMLCTPNELTRTLAIIDSVKQELTVQGFAFDPHIKVGGMIEVPSAAIIADLFAKKLDFMSIGTNDLIQYTIAIDRSNERLNYLYDPIHPAILRLIQLVINAGKHAQIPVSLCGEMASDIRFTRVLLAMGLEEFSVHPSSLLEIKQAIHNTEVNERLKKKVQKLQTSTDPIKSQQILEEINTVHS